MSLRLLIAVLVVLAAVAVATEPGAMEDPSIHLAVELADGSRVIGVPDIEVFPLHTLFGKVETSLGNVVFIEFAGDNEHITVTMVDGGRLSGVHGLEMLRLTTVFGDIVIDCAHVRRVTVRSGRLLAGLVLHYAFDNDREDGTVIDHSGSGHHGKIAGGVQYVETPSGRGIRTSSRDTYVQCDAVGIEINGWRQLTVAVRVNLSRYTTYGRLINRGREGGGGAFSLTVGGVYSGRPYPCGFSVRLGPEGNVSVGRIDRFAELNRWYHLAGVYDGRSVIYYVDGEAIAQQAVPEELWNSPIWEDTGCDLFIGKCSVRRAWHDTHIDGMIDEVMIFDRALSPTDIAQLARQSSDGSGSR